MSMMRPMAGSSGQIGETVATFTEYEAAQKAVSSLVEADVPAREIAIIGTGLRSVERVTGRLGYATAARTGAVNGVLIGLFFSAILVLGAPDVPIAAFIGTVFLGVAVGILLSLISYTIVRRRRDFASVMQVVAEHYEVTVLPTSVHKAREVLGTVPAPRRPIEVDDDTPPRYGERLPKTRDSAAQADGQQPPTA